MKILICEDEALYAQMIADYCEEFGHEVVAVVHSADGFEKNIAQANLVLMDINLGEENGIEIIQRASGLSFKTIFITAYSDEETISQAGLLQPEDYIIKPFGKEQLRARLQLTAMKSEATTIELSTASGEVELDPLEVVYIESYRNYVNFHLANKNILKARMTFQELESFLPNYFVRIHKSYCINKKHLKSLSSKACVLTNHIELPVGRKYKDDL